jgi:hypothetical protein
MADFSGIACKKCLPKEKLDRRDEFTGLWDVAWDTDDNRIAVCTNCGFIRPYPRRQARVDQITPSQQRQIDFIKGWFEKRMLYGEQTELYRFEVELWETGKVHVWAETTESYLTSNGVMLLIGRRGGITILSAIGLSKVFNKKYYAKKFGGRIGQ